MTAEHYLANLAEQFPMSGVYQPLAGYYRSKLFVVPAATNALLAAAGPIFSLLERLAISAALPEIQHIRDNIEHELHAFHSRLGATQYTVELVAIAHYLLCATIDEIIGKNYLRVYAKPAEFNAFTPPSVDQVGPETRFFEIINHIKERTNQYLDLVELAYYCLISGFEGQYHIHASGRQMLDDTIEELYQLIQRNRVNKPHALLPEKVHLEPLPPEKNRKVLLLSIACTFCLLCLFYWGSHALLEQKAKNMLQGHALFEHMDPA